jgi:type II secretory pathway predicted ATPase ExeA/predicted transcriptional regulator
MGRPASTRITNPPREQFEKLGLSYAEAAREMKVPTSTLYFFVVKGIIPRMARYADLPKHFNEWLENAKKAKGQVQAEPLARIAFRRGIKEKELATLSGVDPSVLWHGLHAGVWPNIKTKRKVEKTIEEIAAKREEAKMLTKTSLPEEVLDYWSLKRDPFTNEMEGTDDIFESKELSRAEKKIMNAVDKSGLVAITGQVGSGKSTLIKKIEARLAKRHEVVVIKPWTIEKQFLGASHICDAIIEDLGGHLPSGRRTLEFKARFVGRMLEAAYKDGKRVVIMIDEAHLLRPDALLALKRIYEFEAGFKKLLAIVLVGQQGLARELKSNFTIAEFSQRVDLYELASLDGAMGSYLRHKLERAGSTKEIFELASIKAMARRIDTPLGVNNLASAALIAAHELGEKQVTSQIIEGVYAA